MRTLVVSTWFPYPPNQGSKTRAYHLLRALASEGEVSLLSFRDTDISESSLRHVREICEYVEVVNEEPFAQSALGKAFGWFSPKPRAIVGNYSKRMAKAVEARVSDWNPDIVVALTFIAAMYAKPFATAFRVADVDNLLALMLFEEYQAASTWHQKIRRYLAYRKFRRFERDLYTSFDLNLVTSNRDVDRIKEYMPLDTRQVLAVENGVDLNHYLPQEQLPTEGSMIFNGSVNYQPNFDAIEYFLNDIYPSIRRDVPDAKLRITGKVDKADLGSLQGREGVEFTGYLDDIRKPVAESMVCVVPLRKGAGTRLKILEAMALGVPVVTTVKGAEGLRVEPGRHVLVAENAQDFAQKTVRVLTDPQLRGWLAENGVELVRAHYGWEQIGSGFVDELTKRINGSRHVA